MSRRTVALILALSAGLAGCASKPVVPDSTPQSPTAIIEQHMTSNGIKGFFPFETDDTRYVRPAMQRDDSMFKGTGTFSGIFVGTHNGTKIYRVDRKLQWTLNADKAEYTECPLRGCPVARGPREQPQGAAQPQQPQAQHERGCTMRIAKSKFTVTETGKKQAINGFDTAEYRLAWVVTLRDNKAHTSTSTLDVDLWTTPLTPDMRAALDTEAAYARAYARATELPAPFARGAGKPQILPDEATRLIMSYMAGALKQGERSPLFAAGREMEKIKGHPILTQIIWDMDGNACAASEESHPSRSRASSSPPASGGGLTSGLANLFAERGASKATDQAAREPLLSFSVEVKQLKMAPVHDGMFGVPANYKRVQAD